MAMPGGAYGGYGGPDDYYHQVSVLQARCGGAATETSSTPHRLIKTARWPVNKRQTSRLGSIFSEVKTTRQLCFFFCVQYGEEKRTQKQQCFFGTCKRIVLVLLCTFPFASPTRVLHATKDAEGNVCRSDTTRLREKYYLLEGGSRTARGFSWNFRFFTRAKHVVQYVACSNTAQSGATGKAPVVQQTTREIPQGVTAQGWCQPEGGGGLVLGEQLPRVWAYVTLFVVPSSPDKGREMHRT